MQKDPKLEPKPVDFTSALANFRVAMSELRKTHPEISGREKTLEKYVLDDGETHFWNLVTWYKTVMPIVDIGRVFYKRNPDDDDNLGVDKRCKESELKSDLNEICSRINAFCGEGLARNELLDNIYLLYLKRLREIAGVEFEWPGHRNMITILRDVINENRDDLIAAVIKKKSRPVRADFFVAYLLEVFKRVFPDFKVSRGGTSLCYNLILIALKSCAPDDDLPPLDKIKKTLESRIKRQVGEPTLFLYSESSDRIECTAVFNEIMTQARA